MSALAQDCLNTIIQGDCTEVIAQLPDACIDIVITDPPYGARYRDRSGRTVLNDNNLDWVAPAYTQVYRVLKPDTFCISFYGWGDIETFMSAWKSAGFRPVGHLVWHKAYASRTSYLSYRHEQAFLLTKGRPARPRRPLSDVLPWTYSGNVHHPTEKSVSIIEPLIKTFSAPDAIVLDPFVGSGTTAIAARLLGRHFIGIELDPAHCLTADQRLL